MTEFVQQEPHHSKAACAASLGAIRDTLYVLNGKWKLPIILTLSYGPNRFSELQRTLADITPKILSKELKELELNDFVTRTVHPTMPVTVEYALTEYSQSLNKIIGSMREWGMKHKERMKENLRQNRTA